MSELLRMIDEYLAYIDDDEDEIPKPNWYNRGWFDCDEYSEVWDQQLLRRARDEIVALRICYCEYIARAKLRSTTKFR